MAKTCIYKYRVRRKAQVKLRAQQRVKQKKHLYIRDCFLLI